MVYWFQLLNRLFMPSTSRARGFTLIELLIVITIIGLVATISVASISTARARSRDTKRASDMKQIQKALELSYEPGSGYPVVASPLVIGTATTDVLCGLGSAAGFKADQTAGNCDAGKIFMGLVPFNPTPGGASYTYRSTTGAGVACTVAPCNGFCVQTTLERGVVSSGLAAGTIMVDQTALKNGTCP